LSSLGRFSVVSQLPPQGDWRRVLALDRGGGEPRAVVLAFVSAQVLDDPARLAAVVREVEAAGRLHHPGAVTVLGTETVGDALAVVEEYRPGATLRAILDAGGRLPHDVAARIAVDACAAIARAHALDAGAGRSLVHGAIDPSRIVISDEGAALVAGFGTGVGGGAADDIRALAAVLHECLAGEAPGPAAAALDAPGIPPALAVVVSRALAPAQGLPSAAALAEAVVAAGPIASHADVAAYADAILSPDDGSRGVVAAALRGGGVAEVMSEDFVVDPTEPEVRAPAEATPEPLPRPPSTRPGADPAGVFAAPRRAEERSRAPAVAAVCAVIGFGLGFALQRVGPMMMTGRSAAPSAAAPATSLATPSEAPTEPTAIQIPTTRAPPPVAISPRPPVKGSGAKSAGSAARKTAGKPVREASAGKGMLRVTAPAEAEVFLDGRAIGKGDVHVEIPEGAHRIEVRLGEARVSEKFTLARGETWTYDVTPTQ